MDPNFDDEAPEPDGWMWVRGVDYVAGWRGAVDAAVGISRATSPGLATQPGGSGSGFIVVQ